MSRPIELVVYTRDRHPPNHCSFREQGGPWPPHCVEGTKGYQFHAEIPMAEGAVIIDKGNRQDVDTYSGFESGELAGILRQRHIERCIVGGLATDYCVLRTVLDGLKEGLTVCVLTDAIAPVEAQPGDEERAILHMRSAGAMLTDSGQIQTILSAYHKPTALLVIDCQYDFFPGGALPVAEGRRVIAPLRQILHVATSGRPLATGG